MLWQNAEATGVELADSTIVLAKNVVVAAGTFRSPQLLQLSGIGSAVDLRQYSEGVPMDWIVFTTVPKEGLAEAIKKDKGTGPDAATHPFLISCQPQEAVFLSGSLILKTSLRTSPKFGQFIKGESVPAVFSFDPVILNDKFQVKGVKGLRVVDASVIPLALSAHIQALVYALTKPAAAVISGKA
ncbi:hypothetical protein EDB81DRAFT_765475 [Dactylonectria macrodidyma]|uniref:Glucose-methanol-choline oxidoreductase N-terminal domain-containing protein n=1 Tax=Dactylonectria macrodidyma TaxID=307937 RepID=A0A9P9DQ46_9HYPO|nr:hypothetical protein EDB81DRAFT_765475 [Dactylonectria macrodidyma]